MLDPVEPTEPIPWDIIRISMVIGPVSGYFHQYYTMYKMKTSMGFSSVTCGVLIVSNILRVFFWIGTKFDIALLYQSILMIIVQLFLLELCVRYYPWTVQLPVPVTHSIPSSRLHNRVGSPALGSSTNSRPGSPAIPSGLGSTGLGAGGALPVTNRGSRQGLGWYKEHAVYWGAHFWNWPNIWPYFLFLAVFTLLLKLSLVAFGDSSVYFELLGLAALGIEATVPLPQAIQNYHSKSTAGFSPAILLMWVIGDSFKTYFYISTHTNYQFIACGIIQLCIDCVIIIQTIIYSKWWKDASRTKEGPLAGFTRYFSGGRGWSRSRTHPDAVGGNASSGVRRSSSEALLASRGEDDE